MLRNQQEKQTSKNYPSLCMGVIFILKNMPIYILKLSGGFPGGSADREFPCNVGDLGSIPGLGRSSGDGNSYSFCYTHNILVWRIQSMGSQRVGHDWATFTSLHFRDNFKTNKIILGIYNISLIICKLLFFKYFIGHIYKTKYYIKY